MHWPKRFRRFARDGILVALGLAALGLPLAVYLARGAAERWVRMKVSCGNFQGLRHQMALALRSEAANARIGLTLRATAGSEEMLDLVDAGALDMALVQGGLGPGNRKNVRQVAALHVEPLHLLVKEEAFDEVAANLAALKGKSINLSVPLSGTHALASEVLKFAGLNPGPGGDYRTETLGYEQLVGESDRDRLPDAVFMVSMLPSPVARRLVARHRYRLVPLPFAAAFALDAMMPEEAPSPRSGRINSVRRTYVYDTLIPAFTYGVKPAVPPEMIHTLGTRLLLVANKDADPRAVARLLDVVFSTPFSQRAHPPLDPKLLELPPELPVHEGTLLYLERNKPLIAADVIDAIEKEVSIAGGVLGALFFLWQLVRRQYRRQRDRGFEHYILRVMEIDRQTLEQESAARIDLGGLLKLQQDLMRMKQEALEKFAQGELGGEELISGFLEHVSDAREQLTRLILHERQTLEKTARHEGRPLPILWHEAVSDRPDPPVPEMPEPDPAR